MTKSWLAISLNDFHRPEKVWQGRDGKEDFVRCQVIGARSLARAKAVAKTFNDDAWLLAPLHVTYNIAYVEVKK